ncbi:MAG: hypothetical protein IT557_20050 [Alphaproteobacteria bacterium]|nr:hypothetical protein [Alphaproteobacteria bacterium]
MPHQAEAAPGQPPAPSAASLIAPAQAAPVAGALRPPERPEGRRGDTTGLPLPRFASLRAERVNLRAGPGSRFRVEWTYVRRDLPVEIVREHDVWRRVRDPEGVEGWVHQQMLSGRRTFIVRGAERALRRAPSENAVEVARLAPGVVGQFRRCAEPSDWCEVQAAGHRGYLRRGEVWGIYAGETVD